jgi:hypothetical protein
MIMKSKLTHGAISAKYQSRLKGESSDAKRTEPSYQALLLLVLWTILVCATTDGAAAVIYHVR